MSNTADTGLIPVTEAAERLGVKPATLYAYISRRRLDPVRRDGDRRTWLRVADIDELRRRGRSPREPGTEVRIVSAVTHIDGRGFRYRGRNPLQMAGRDRFEAVATLLLDERLPRTPPIWAPDRTQLAVARAAVAPVAPVALPIDRLRVGLPALALLDDLRFDVRPEALRALGPRLIATLAALLAPDGHDEAQPLGERLLAILSPFAPSRDRVAAVDGALVLLADHELAASTMAVRIAARYGADPYAAMAAGLAALSGTRHGAASLAVEALLDDVAAGGDAAAVLGARLRRGDAVPGLGHPLYPQGDPRAPRLLELTARADGDAQIAEAVRRVVGAVADRGLPPPNVDLALAALSRGLRMAPGSGEAIFAIARTAGWLAHAAEEYAAPSGLRFRAVPA
jgi:citrate synthase